MDEKERIKNLKDIRECLIESYGQDSYFKSDLDEILKAINHRIDLHKLQNIDNIFKRGWITEGENAKTKSKTDWQGPMVGSGVVIGRGLYAGFSGLQTVLVGWGYGYEGVPEKHEDRKAIQRIDCYELKASQVQQQNPFNVGRYQQANTPAKTRCLVCLEWSFS